MLKFLFYCVGCAIKILNRMSVYGSEFFCLPPCKIRNLNIFGRAMVVGEILSLRLNFLGPGKFCRCA
jgi:hypothetical protein